MPEAVERSCGGNHSAVSFTAAGQLPASPTPSRKRSTPKWSGVRASACRSGRRRPEGHARGVADARPEPVDREAGDAVRQRVGDEEGGAERAERGVAEERAQVGVGGEVGERQPLDVVEGGRGEREADHRPAQRRGRRRRHRGRLDPEDPGRRAGPAGRVRERRRAAGSRRRRPSASRRAAAARPSSVTAEPAAGRTLSSFSAGAGPLEGDRVHAAAVLAPRVADVVALVPEVAVPRAGRVDGLAVDPQPGAGLLQVLDRRRVEPAVGVGADAHHEAAALGHRVHEVADDPARRPCAAPGPARRRTTGRAGRSRTTAWPCSPGCPGTKPSGV